MLHSQHTTDIHAGAEMTDYKRLAVYYDDEMIADEEAIKRELVRQGVKPTRSAVVRYALRQTAQQVRRREKREK